MSGGRFDYYDRTLKSRIFGYDDVFSNVFEDREISWLVFDLLDLIHEYDYYVSGDTGREKYLAAKKKFKKKWLSNEDSRTKLIVDEAIEEIRRELYDTYEIDVDGGVPA